MQCPRCQSGMEVLTNNNVDVDVCVNGCGGIWFDQFEFKKMDEKHETDDVFLQKLSQTSQNSVDLEQKISCPKCTEQPMIQRFFSVARNVKIDECPNCAGIWLDAGELSEIYKTFANENEKNQATQKLFDDMFKVEIDRMRKESEEQKQAVDNAMRYLKFITPSYYWKQLTGG